MEIAEIGIIVSLWSFTLALIANIINIRRNNKHDDKQEASEQATLITKIENINNGIIEIKSDVRGMRTDIQEVRERLVVVEHSVQSAHHRLDVIERTEGVKTHENE